MQHIVVGCFSLSTCTHHKSIVTSKRINGWNYSMDRCYVLHSYVLYCVCVSVYVNLIDIKNVIVAVAVAMGAHCPKRSESGKYFNVIILFYEWVRTEMCLKYQFEEMQHQKMYTKWRNIIIELVWPQNQKYGNNN